MDLKQLRAIGAVKDRSIVSKTIVASHRPLLPESEWPDGGTPIYAAEPIEHEMEVLIRKTSSADTVEISMEQPHMRPLKMVMRCVVDAKGKQLFPTIEDVENLEEWLFLPLYVAVAEVNHLGPKQSPPKTSSGANSPSPSGDEASPNGSTPSPPTSGEPGSSTGESTDP